MNHSDQWFWRKDLKGLYSVRNGYRELYGEAIQPDSCNFKSWNQLWRLKIPPKIKNFIWRCARNILPVKTVLLQRRVEIPPDCPLCHKEVESRSHLFLDCEFSKPVWDNTILPLHILEASFESWLSQVVDLDDENKSRSIIAILWTVWKNRNEYVWNNKQWNVNAIRISVTNCIKDWQCWCDLQKANTSSIPLQTVQRTQGIDASWVYCEVDASVIENSASFGAVIRTHSGLFLAAISGPLRPVNEARLAEALAIKEALSWLKSKQWQKICILTDCQQVCLSFSDSSQDLSYTFIDHHQSPSSMKKVTVDFFDYGRRPLPSSNLMKVMQYSKKACGSTIVSNSQQGPTIVNKV
nr:uncharacterized protein LOC109176397 [Ipomoea batatas]